MNYIIMIKEIFFFYFSCFVCFSVLIMDQVLQRFGYFLFHCGKNRLLKDGFLVCFGRKKQSGLYKCNK